jgi:AAA+ superfamily predicted ATPase
VIRSYVSNILKQPFLLATQVGEAEKLVRTLFMVAIDRQPSVIFMDEVLVTNQSYMYLSFVANFSCLSDLFWRIILILTVLF